MSSPSQTQRQRILIVEDDAITRSILAEYLRLAGFEPLIAGTGEQALHMLRDPGMVVDWLYTDIRLPGMVDGWVVGAEFHLAHPSRPIVYATANARQSDAQAVRSLFVQKPFDPARIVDFFVQQAASA